MEDEEINELFIKADEVFGSQIQMLLFVEESLELLLEFEKLEDLPLTENSQLIEEIADVWLMFQQLVITFDLPHKNSCPYHFETDSEFYHNLEELKVDLSLLTGSIRNINLILIRKLRGRDINKQELIDNHRSGFTWLNLIFKRCNRWFRKDVRILYDVKAERLKYRISTFKKGDNYEKTKN